MPEHFTLARLKKAGKTFEISIDPEAALRFKRGQMQDVREALLADHIFTDAKKGLLASQQELQQFFGSSEPEKVAAIIIKDGEIQETAEQRQRERQQREKKLIYLISRNAADPRTGLPHPPERIKAALEQGKLHLEEHRPVEEQFDEMVRKLRPILPIKLEQKKVTVTIPAQYAGRLYGEVSRLAAILRQDWQSDGSWKAVVELPAGLYQEFLDKLNSMTHGSVVVE